MSITDEMTPTTVRRRRSDAVRAEMTRRTRSFTELAQAVRSAGLNRRTRWFYLAVFGGLVAALAGAFTGLVLLQDSWFQLLIAAALGIIFTQFAFLGHEASHRQVVTSGPANDRIGMVLANFFVGISYSWWMSKHTRHHANPQRVGKDPDIQPGTLSFRPEDAATTTGAHALDHPASGLALLPAVAACRARPPPVVLPRAVRPRPHPGPGGRTHPARDPVRRLPRGRCSGCSPSAWRSPSSGCRWRSSACTWARASRPTTSGCRSSRRTRGSDFLDKQVLTSRNVSGGWWMTILMGGLNYQIEHHLFPSMPRPHLRAARRLVRRHCHEQGVTYTETSLPEALTIVVRYLSEVGLAAPRSFNCPTAAGMGRG